MTMDDVKQFNNNYIKNRPKSYVILGKEADMKFEELDKIGNVKKLSQEEIFGY